MVVGTPFPGQGRGRRPILNNPALSIIVMAAPGCLLPCRQYDHPFWASNADRTQRPFGLVVIKNDTSVPGTGRMKINCSDYAERVRKCSGVVFQSRYANGERLANSQPKVVGEWLIRENADSSALRRLYTGKTVGNGPPHLCDQSRPIGRSLGHVVP